MNYIKPEDIKEYVSKNPTGIAGMSEELTVMVNHFAELIVRECANQCDLLLNHKMSSEWARGTHDCSKAIKKHFGVEK